MNKEIERKYAIKYLPEDIKCESVKNIEQAFIYKDLNTIIRIRKITDSKNEEDVKYIYTLKTKGDIEYDNKYNIAQKYEIETKIKKEDYEKLLKAKISNIINKTRIVVPIKQNLKVEIDVYEDYLKGLLTAEIEFTNEEQAQNFEKPDWLGEELGYKELSNRKLSEMTREQWIQKISNEVLENNKKIIDKLKRTMKF